MKHHQSARTRVFMTLKHAKRGYTCEEIEMLLKMRHQTASARLWELEKDGIAQMTSMKRMTSSGRYAHVWVLMKPEDKP